ncbi:TetR/AcrR family transcriptional regulator [Nocardia sp. CWNU-33]|uniref:TetR/AcrR family transcriptional regulator n=1 Tax=Nocardia sp. CWNU-33 TaxID=3392117 RepID=UPI00398EC1D7
MVEATRLMVEANGYHGTGLKQVLELAEAPRGSLYHHFPGGKDELVGEALAVAGRDVDRMVKELALQAPTLGDLVRALLETLADRMVAADYSKGCPVATVALEVAATNDALQPICGGIYAGWQRTLADALRADGHAPAEADELATTALALIEGALVLARAGRSRIPVEQVGRRIARLLTKD